jgi:hypothetical protein
VAVAVVAWFRRLAVVAVVCPRAVAVVAWFRRLAVVAVVCPRAVAVVPAAARVPAVVRVAARVPDPAAEAELSPIRPEVPAVAVAVVAWFLRLAVVAVVCPRAGPAGHR